MAAISSSKAKEVLIQNNAVFIHCSGFAKGHGTPETHVFKPLERLTNAIAHPEIELSCSTVQPRDTFARGNYSGTIGIILFPSTENSVTFADKDDAGSSPSPSGPRTHNSPIGSIDNLTKAIQNRPAGYYNEIGIKDYAILGLFLEPTVQFAGDHGTITISHLDIYETFEKLVPNFFLLIWGQLYQADYQNGGFRPGPRVSIKELLEDI